MLTDPQFLKLLLSLLVALAMAPGVYFGWQEWRHNRLRTGAGFTKGNWISLSTIPPNVLIHVLMAPVWLSLYQWLHLHRSGWIEVPGVFWQLPIVFLLCDFSYYWEHRCAHGFKPLWRLYHGTHHTARAFNIPVAYRVSALNHLVAPLFYAPWIWFGFDPLVVIAFQLLVFHFQGWVHTELIGSLPWLDTWLNTPANHRIHHSAAEQHRDRNFGAVLMCWDRLFGTYTPPEHVQQFGIPASQAPDSFIGVYRTPWSR